MRIAGFTPESYQDHPHGLSCVIFTSGCNFSCPSCHAKQCIFTQKEHSKEETEQLLRNIERDRRFVEKVVFCGGEPTLQEDLPLICGRFRKQGFSVKLDTNGYNPEVLEELLTSKVINYVALDVKAPPTLYAKVTGMADGFDITRIKSSLRIIQNFPHELRTTIVPILKDNNLCWFNEEEAREMASWVYDVTGREYKVLVRGEDDRKGDKRNAWYLQQFVARSKEEMVDERFSRENLTKEMQKTPEKVMEKSKHAMNGYFAGCKTGEK